MENNKLIIIALLVIIIALLACILTVMPNMNKQDVKLAFISDSTINEGDSIEIQLTDMNGTPLANQSLNVSVTDGNKTDYHSILTNGDGKATLDIDKSAGDYGVSVRYDGNSNYRQSSISQNVTVKVPQTTSASTGSQSSALPYSLNNLPPSNDPYPETSREQVSEYIVMQKYEDGYISYVDLRTGKRSSGGYYK